MDCIFSKALSDQLIMVILMRGTACAPREKSKKKTWRQILDLQCRMCSSIC